MKKLITILAFLFVSSGSTDDKDLANTILESPIPRELNIKQICKIYTDYTINLVRYSEDISYDTKRDRDELSRERDELHKAILKYTKVYHYLDCSRFEKL